MTAFLLSSTSAIGFAPCLEDGDGGPEEGRNEGDGGAEEELGEETEGEGDENK